MSIKQNSNNTKQLGGFLLTIGWVICLIVIGVLYHKSLYSAKEPKIIINQSEAKIIIPKSFDSHYHIQGQIDNQLIDFIIDTGATKLSLSENLAKKFNLSFGPVIKISTANGDVDGYLTTIPNIIIGKIEFNNISALIMPNMSDEALLGMNILKKFDISQHDDNLILIYKQ